jgi:hypothetical protein
MKTLIKLFFVAVILSGSITITNAQATRKEKQAAKAAKIKDLLDSRF